MTQAPINCNRSAPGPRLWRGPALLALVSGALLVWAVLGGKPLTAWWTERAVVAVGEQTYELTHRDWRAAFERAVAARVADEGATIEALEEDIGLLVTEAFTLPRSQVSAVGDWYYSMAGTGSRGLASMAGLWGESGDVVMAQHITDRLFPEDQWAAAHSAMLATLMARTRQGSQRSLDSMQSTLHRELATYAIAAYPEASAAKAAPDWNTDSLTLTALAEDTLLVNSLAATSATALGAVATLRVVAQRRAAMTAAARLAGRSTTAKGSAACLTTGPWAPLCASGMVAATVIATEWAIMTMDERSNRADFEAALDHDIDQLEAELRTALQRALLGNLEAEFTARATQIDAQFRPIDAVFDRTTRP